MTTTELEQKESEARRFIKRTIKQYKYPYSVAFSGGKDSLVTAGLVRQVDPRVPLFYVDTTIDFPQATALIQRLKKEGWNIKTFRPFLTFLELSEKLGPPSRKRRWCQYVCKESIVAGYIKHQQKPGWLQFIGIRKEEGGKRSSYKRIDNMFRSGLTSGKLKKQDIIRALPILYFTEKDVWGFIKKHKLPYCDLYNDSQVSRLACVICPVVGEKSEKVAWRYAPKIARQYDSFLKRYAREEGLGKNWHKGAWRSFFGYTHKKIVGTKEVIGKRLYRYRFSPEVKLNKAFFVPFRKEKNIKIKILPGERSMIVHQPKWEARNILLRVENQILKSLNCIGCGYCLSLCEHIILKKRNIHIKDNCTSCLECAWKSKCVSLIYGRYLNIFMERKTEI